MSKLYRACVGLWVALIASAALANGADISAQRLLQNWKGEDSGMRMVAEVIASAFASGFSWGGADAGKRAYCSSPNLKGGQIISAFEVLLRDHPKMNSEPYCAAMAETLTKDVSMLALISSSAAPVKACHRGTRDPYAGNSKSGLGKAPRNPPRSGVLIGSVGPDSAQDSPYGCHNLSVIDVNVEELRQK